MGKHSVAVVISHITYARTIKVDYSRFGAKRDKARADCRIQHEVELYDLCSSPNIIWVIISRMRWAGHATRMGGSRGAYKVLVGNREGQKNSRRNKT
jgi:hypothetical protein